MSEQATKAGDWVSFMRNAQIVYGKVEYVRERKAWQRANTLVTTAGEVDADSILELRGPTEKGAEG